MKGRFLPLLFFTIGACGLDTSPPNGQQACAAEPGQRCNKGYYCAEDEFCWLVGTGPMGQVVPDADVPPPGQMLDAATPPEQPDAEIATDTFVPHTFVPAPSGHALVSGGVQMKSANYQAILTLSQSPGGNRTTRSAGYLFVGGLVGSISDLKKE